MKQYRKIEILPYRITYEVFQVEYSNTCLVWNTCREKYISEAFASEIIAKNTLVVYKDFFFPLAK